MLDTETKSRIDSARDILVGKVPDPKSQVEQITIALIYKFMDDMDRQSEEVGGKSSFFKGEFKKYRWADLLDKRFGGHERLLLYAEGIERMNENKNIPQLFRDIFKGVFLPYRDPETLNLFLKEINRFSYEHSERLGDAYEYLLSVLGTQGDAGQFRTPRHHIDFMVQVIAPQKHETVLDPACGTAGFLISDYKYILKHNENLTPDERARLMTNFCGYDIAPDMVRLSRVNLYLHGFPNPVIYEYDTLTSEERWDERYDVIMANPPFMTPKGGIRPHNRFSIKANRSELLFVDYIAEHLNPGGRAGIIVPEGIIFQSQNAYKNLRRMLVENYLWAIVSLPAGVFNPYSGVKTSILFLDRNLARRTDAVLFVKIANDGFDLGAQRREIGQNDIPEALKTLLAWKANQKPPKEGIAHAVSRKRLLESPDVSLSGDRYRAVAVRANGKWPRGKLGEVCKQDREIVEPNSNQAAKLPYLSLEDVESETGRILKIPIAGNSEQGKSTSFRFDNRHVLYGKLRPYLNKVALPDFDGRCTTELIPLLPTERLNRHFLGYMLRRAETVAYAMQGKTGSRMPRADMEALLSFEIPLPPLAEQERIVAELDGYRNIIEGARRVIVNYKPTFRADPQWPPKNLGEFVRINNGGVLTEFVDNGRIACIKVSDMNLTNNQWEIVTSSHWVDEPPHEIVPENSVIFPKRGAAIATNKKRLTKIPCLIDNNCMALTVAQPNDLDSSYLFYFLRGFDLASISNSAGIALINNDDINSVQIPIPPRDLQREIVAQIEAERALVDSNQKLIEIFEAKIKGKLDEIWGEADDAREGAG